MKNKFVTRVLSLMLVLALSLSMLPQTASAASKKTQGVVGAGNSRSSSYGTVYGYWSNDRIRRNDRYTYPYEFYSTLNSCTGFTLDYEILEVNKGNLNGNFVYEVLVRTTSGAWKSVGTFYMKNTDYKTTKITFDNPLSIDAVMVVCQKKSGEFGYVCDLEVCNPTYQRSYIPTAGAVGGYWSSEELRRSNHTSYPFELYSPIRRCKGFTLNYEITEITKGKLDGNFKYTVVVRTTSGEWRNVADFQMKGNSTSTYIRLNNPISFDAVAVFCLKNATVEYSYYFTITNPVTK